MTLKIKIFADGADKAGMVEMNSKPWLAGFTTNPTLMRKAGISDYRAFAKDILSVIKEKPISFEVFSDDEKEMERQAHEIASWSKNVYVKIPITNTKGQSMVPLVARLHKEQIPVNVTAILTVQQVAAVAKELVAKTPTIISVFAGRIADTGRDPIPAMEESMDLINGKPNVELLWASTRELFNVVQADSIGCDIITVTNDVLKKLDMLGTDLSELSLATVKMFYDDAQKAGFQL